MFRSKIVIGAGVAAVVLLGGTAISLSGSNDDNSGKSTTTRKVVESTTTTIKKPDPGTPLGMFCTSFEKYLAEGAKPTPANKNELEQAVKNGRAILAEVVERALPDIAPDSKKLRDGTFTYWDELAKVGYDVAKVSNEAKTKYLQDTAAARTNLERFGTGTCGIVTTTSTTAPAKK